MEDAVLPADLPRLPPGQPAGNWKSSQRCSKRNSTTTSIPAFAKSAVFRVNPGWPSERQRRGDERWRRWMFWRFVTLIDLLSIPDSDAAIDDHRITTRTQCFHGLIDELASEELPARDS